MTTNHALKQGKRYRYYISRCLNGKQPDAHTGWRIPAHEIENVLAESLNGFLIDPIHVMEAFRSASFSDEDTIKLTSALTQNPKSQQDLRELIHKTIERIDIARDNMRLSLNLGALAKHIRPDRKSGETDPQKLAYVLTASTKLRRRGVETKIILTSSPHRTRHPDKRLIKLIAQAHYWFDLLKRGEVHSIAQIATREKICAGDVSRFLPLAFLSPKIIEAILEGRHPVELSSEKLKRMPSPPLIWDLQLSKLGFDS